MNNYKKLICKIAAVAFLPGMMGLASCSEDIDESNLYTFTGETIEDYLANRPDQFSSFNYILQRAGLDKLMSGYGTYTCFAPTNEAVTEYIDSLYNDQENKELPHNGMTENSLEGLTDSLCNDIAKFHIAATEVMAINMESGMTINTMLGRDINTNIDSITGSTIINAYSHITSMDNELENGVLHEIDHVIRRSNLLVAGEMEKHPDLFTLFSQALKLTGLADSLTKKERKLTPPANSYNFYTPEKAILGYTIFAETDDVLAENNINNIEDLISHANDVYGNCAAEGSGWYDYYRNNGITVSTGTDYQSPYNCLNMWVRYHIISQRVPYDKMVIDWNQVTKVPLYEYYETMLPMTLVKVIRSAKAGAGKLFLNRYEANSTLTDQVAELGSDAIHQVVDGHSGIEIAKDNIQALNGYLHPIQGMLEYESWVPKGVLNERIRFDVTSMTKELGSANLRGALGAEINALNGSKTGTDGNLGGDYVRIPIDFSENMIIYNGESTRLYYLAGRENNWNNYQGDEYNSKGNVDLAFRLPPVPDGTYELRVGVSLNGNRGMYQFYLGEGTNNRTQMEALDIPLDERTAIINKADGSPDPTTGWTLYTAMEDLGVETDNNMHNLGWMRGPLYYTVGKGTSTVARSTTGSIRRIVARREFKQGTYWFRIKSALDDDSRQMYFDYMELVPVNVYNNTRYLEDMY